MLIVTDVTQHYHINVVFYLYLEQRFLQDYISS